MVELAGALGLEIGTETGADAEIDALVTDARCGPRRADFAEADRIRDGLAAQGVTLEDTPTGTIWHRS